jgi:hydroxymethylbilane synthase
MKVLRIGTRASPLARVQTDSIAAQLRDLYPSLRVEVCPISTTGDRSQHTDAPSADWGMGVFVKELEAALIRREIDLAVHSLKDVPAQLPEGLAIVAVPPRADPRDVLVSPSGACLETLPEAALVGSTSARRVAFLRAARPDLRFGSIRGNIDTRCRKLFAGEYDAIVLARAGLERLGLEVDYSVIDPRVLPPAPGQGALALEALSDNVSLRALLQPLHHAATAAAVEAERALMAGLDAGCRLPLAALATPDPGPGAVSAGVVVASAGVVVGSVGVGVASAGNGVASAGAGVASAGAGVAGAGADGGLTLTAAVAAPDGSHILRATEQGELASPSLLGRRVAARLRQAGALDLLARSAVTPA